MSTQEHGTELAPTTGRALAPRPAPLPAVPEQHGAALQPRSAAGDLAVPRTRHEIRIEDRRTFTQAVCSCGWAGASRRARSSARDEARDHALLYADGSALLD